MTLLAIDPGIVSPGVALFSGADNALVACAQIKFTLRMEANPSLRCLDAADAIVNWMIAKGTELHIPWLDTVAHEWPQVYAEGKGKGNPNQLLPMVGVDLACVAMLRALQRTAIEVLSYTPAEWIGQCPKDTRPGKAHTSPRGKRIMSRLTSQEVARVPNQHDIVDAVGIGLHALGRLGVRRVYTSS